MREQAPAATIAAVTANWQHGDVIVRREVIGLERAGSDASPPAGSERVWFGMPVHVVADDADQLVTYIGPGAEFGFVPGTWPTETTRHPWHGQQRWNGNGCLMVQRRAEEFAVWHFWDATDHSLQCWYVNFQAAYRRTQVGFDTLDFELDIVVFPDGTWTFKDRESMADRVAEGRLQQHTVDRVLALGDQMASELDAGRLPWDTTWASSSPPDSWRDAELRTEWSAD